MTDEQILAMFNNGKSRKDIAAYAGKTVAQVKHALDRARRDPAVGKAMAAIGTQMVPHSMWIKTPEYSMQLRPASDTNGDDNIITRLQDAFADIPAYEPVAAEFDYSEELHAYALFDAHIGMRAYGKETAGDDYDLKLAETDIKAAFTRLAGNGGEALLIIGGDTLHHDNNDNTTFASKHPLDVDGRIFKVTMDTVDIMSWTIEHLMTKHEKVTVKVHRGNHDPHSHIALAVGLHQRYRNTDRVLIDMTETDWYWKKWGKCSIFTTHGDRGKPDTFIHKMADICPFWSESPHRIAITGHVHKFQMQRIGGAMWCSVDGFCPPDQYGSQFAGRRGLAKMVFDKEHGLKGMMFDPVWRA